MLGTLNEALITKEEVKQSVKEMKTRNVAGWGGCGGRKHEE